MENLFKLRTEKGVSQVNIAIKIGVAQETVSGYEIGRVCPTVENLLKLCNLFQVSADYLLDLTDIRTPVNKLVIEKMAPKELELISMFRSLSAEKQERVMGILMGLLA